METNEQRISALESRVKTLEALILNADAPTVNVSRKEKTLREIIKGKKFNGQEQVAAIVGYHEKILGQAVHKNEIKNAWQEAKMNGKYAAIYLTRAQKDALVRILADDTCDLTQTGEDFFDGLLTN
ncbi:MAG TPA: hypothetical protein VJA87_03715 [Candidatus Paceibacterota bacterium]